MDINTIVEQSRASIEKGDLLTLLCIIAPLKPQRIVEIGTWKGYSAEVWIEACKPSDFITIEKDSENICEYKVKGISYRSWYNSDSHDPKVLETLKIYIPEIDFLFIDGDHSYEGVKKDWEMYGSLVRKGGIVVFHDCIYTSDDPNAPVQVKPLWDDLNKSYPYVEIKTTEKSTGMGVLFI